MTGTMHFPVQVVCYFSCCDLKDGSRGGTARRKRRRRSRVGVGVTVGAAQMEAAGGRRKK